MSIPHYAKGVPQPLLVQCLCHGHCGGMQYAMASTEDWRGTTDLSVYATCLKCGYRARDSYKWQNP